MASDANSLYAKAMADCEPNYRKNTNEVAFTADVIDDLLKSLNIQIFTVVTHYSG